MAITDADTQTLLLELASTDTRDFHEAIRKILKLDAQALEVDRVNFWRFQRAPLAITCVEGYVAAKDSFECGTTLLGRDYPRYFCALQQETVIAADDARADRRTSEFHPSYFEPLGITSMMDVPVWVGGALVGVVCHEHVGPPRVWTPQERQLALSVGQAVATSLEARERQRAELGHRRATFLSEASAALSESLDVDHIPARLAHIAVPTLGDWCVIGVLEGAGLRRLAAAHRDLGKQALLDDLHWRNPPGRRGIGIVERAMEEGLPQLLPRVGEEALAELCASPAQAEAMRAIGARGLIAVPLFVRGQVFGAIALGIGEGRSYTRGDLVLAEELAKRAAIAINNAQLYRELQDAVRARDEFLSIASHELYTPIAALQLSVDSLASGRARNPERMRAIAARQVERLGRLVGELLDATRLRGGRLPLHLEPVSLGKLLRDTVEELRPEAERAGVELRLEISDEVSGHWDRGHLERVVGNLLGNAIKFGRANPVELRLQRVDERARLTVRDYGIGIEPDALPHVFDPYARAVSTREYGGLGLGLFIVRTCVEALGGTIEVASQLGQGTTFVVELPVAGPPA